MSGNNSVVIAPSLLSADFGRLTLAAVQASEGGAERLHFDVMDGRFVPNITFGPQAIQALRPVSDRFYDVHLMIVEPERYIEDFVHAGADGVTVHFEACVPLQRTLAQIRKLGAKAGVALNPSTPPDALEYLLEDLDLVLVMTVNPGFGGQEFLKSMLKKIERVNKLIEQAPHPIRLEVDGGIDRDTAAVVVSSGADTLVAGTSIYGHAGGVTEAIRLLREAAERK